MKSLIKKFIPFTILNFSRNIRLKIALAKEYRKDFHRFFSYASLNSDRNEVDQIRARITYFYHALEKGLSNRNIRFGFGKKALEGLYNALTSYDKMNYSKDDIRYLTAVSVISKYISLHEENNFNVEGVKEKFSKFLTNHEVKYGGVKFINGKTNVDNSKLNFKELANSRVSFRDFSSGKIDLELINESISIAMKTPSVCNRQPWKVYVINDKNLRNEVLEHQRGLKDANNSDFILLMITTDNQYFLGINERNQGYVDGGLFSMSLLYALEYVGLGACALNGALKHEDDQLIRKLLNIRNSENIIMFIAVGQYPTEAKVPKSERDNYSDITTIY